MANRDKWLVPRPGYNSLSNILPQLTRPLYKGRQDKSAYLFSDWPYIVGETLARSTRPLKITFPRDGKGGGTLQLAVTDGSSLEIQHRLDDIREAITVYLGQSLITTIRIVQRPEDETLENGDPKRQEREKQMPELTEELLQSYPDLATITDRELQQRLIDIGTNIELRKKNLLPE